MGDKIEDRLPWDLVLKNMPASYQEWFKQEKLYLESIITPNASVLEIGCGEGRSIYDLLQITEHITGVDRNIEIVLEAQKLFSDYPSVKILESDASKLPFENKSFDFVVCMTTFANFADKKILILNEMKRVLRDNGKIVLSVFSENALEERMKVYNNTEVKIKKIEGGTVYFDIDNEDCLSEQFSENELREIFSKVELGIEGIKGLEIAYLCTLSKR